MHRKIYLIPNARNPRSEESLKDLNMRHPSITHGRGGFGHGGKGRGVAGRGHGEDREFGRRGQRLFAAGDFRLLLLSLLQDVPRHGYELIRTIEEMFSGSYAPSPGVVYPTLALLAEQDLIAPGEGSTDGKKRYAISAAGRAYLADHQALVDGLKARMRLQAGALRGQEIPAEVREAARTLKAALMLNTRPWDMERVLRVRAAIEAAIAAVAHEG